MKVGTGQTKWFLWLTRKNWLAIRACLDWFVALHISFILRESSFQIIETWRRVNERGSLGLVHLIRYINKQGKVHNETKLDVTEKRNRTYIPAPTLKMVKMILM